MDKSYRLKMEDKLSKNILTVEYIINCIAKYDNKISQLAYKEKQWRNNPYNNYKMNMDKMIAYRKPFVDVLMKQCNMSLGDIKEAVANVKEKNIPTKKVCDQIRNIIVSGSYRIDWIECGCVERIIVFVPALPTQILYYNILMKKEILLGEKKYPNCSPNKYILKGRFGGFLKNCI